MIFQNPWAFTGLLALALPVLIHLLGRRSARTQPFPSLRFLTATRLPPVRRTRITDTLILVLRLTIVALAVVALAQPLLLTADRAGDRLGTNARAILVDTSASMLRPTPAGERAIDAARREAVRMADAAGPSVVLETATPTGSMAGAIAWLAAQPGRHEVAIVSDFQAGTLDSLDIARVPAAFGISLHRIGVAPATQPIEIPARRGGMDAIARITLAAERTDVQWTVASTRTKGDALPMLAGSLERERAAAAARAALNHAGPHPPAAGRAVTIVHAGFEQRVELLGSARPLDQPWMAEILAHVHSDAMLAAAAWNAEPISNAALPETSTSSVAAATAPFTAVALTHDARPVAVAARGNVDGQDRLLFFVLVDAGSLAAAALNVAVTNALAVAPPVTELEPAHLPDTLLDAWRRAPSTETVAAEGGASDGRWFWLVAALLLALETWIRRTHREDARREVAHEPVA